LLSSSSWVLLFTGVLSCSDDEASGPDTTAEQQHTISGLSQRTTSTYYWKIRATDSDGYYIESDTASFTTE